MKKLTTKIFLGTAALTGLMLTQSCEKEIPAYNGFESYTYASLDEDGGTWDPILLTSGADTAIAAPEDVTSDAYLAELDEVKGYVGSLNADEQEAVDYWGNNTVIRWQEIAQELVAKYNLAPSPNEDGSYSAPSSANPSVYPYFPFAHPPYAVRAYAYLAAAQYDALITTWNYKYAYNRPAPYKVDGSITPAYPDNDLPSYPSEDAAIAEVSSEMLKFLFPLEVEYIDGLAKECRETRKMAGMNVESDLVAGDGIGGYVFRQYKARAANDSMKFAQVDAATYAGYESAADLMFGNMWPHWENLEVPQRPVGITPAYGKVKTWWIGSPADVRPGPPPAVGSAEYETAKAEMLDLVENATRDQQEIAYFWADGFGTYTPAGHWGRIAADYIVQYRLNPLRTARTFAYMNTAMMDAGISCWDTKYYYMYPRPPQGNEDILCLFGLPNFPSYTSGHSTFSAAAATVLGYVFPSEASLFDSYAKDASESRIYSRIHWRFDCETGVQVGNTIGDMATAVAAADGAD